MAARKKAKKAASMEELLVLEKRVGQLHQWPWQERRENRQ
jgi:hypothetical protein